MEPGPITRYRSAIQRENHLVERGEPVPPELLEQIAAFEAEFPPELLGQLTAAVLGHAAEIVDGLNTRTLACSCGWQHSLIDDEVPAAVHKRHVDLDLGTSSEEGLTEERDDPFNMDPKGEPYERM